MNARRRRMVKAKGFVKGSDESTQNLL